MPIIDVVRSTEKEFRLRTEMDAIMHEITTKTTVSVPAAGRAFGLGRNSAYAAVKSGELPSIRIGGKIAVPTAPLRRMLGLGELETA